MATEVKYELIDFEIFNIEFSIYFKFKYKKTYYCEIVLKFGAVSHAGFFLA